MQQPQWSPVVSICLYIQSLSVLIPSVDPCRKLKMPILPIYIPCVGTSTKNAGEQELVLQWSDPKTLFVFVIHKHKFVAVIIVILQLMVTLNEHISATIGPLTEISASEFNSFRCLQVLYGALLHQSKIEKMNRSLKIDSF